MKLQGHERKPKPLFLGKGAYYIGMELEMEAPGDYEYDAGLALKDKPRFCYAKTDGSLMRGWELITQPIPVERWIAKNPPKGSAISQFFKLVADLRELGYHSHVGSTAGLHLHICRKALEPGGQIIREGGAPGAAFYWFRRIVNGSLFRQLSQRDNGRIDQWARQDWHYYRNIFRDCANDNRYMAVNLTDKTVEVRIFRGNMREDRIRKAVEATVAAIDFARGQRVLPNNYWEQSQYQERVQMAEDDDKFIMFVRRHKNKYPHLWAFIKEKNLVRRLHQGVKLAKKRHEDHERVMAEIQREDEERMERQRTREADDERARLNVANSIDSIDEYVAVHLPDITS